MATRQASIFLEWNDKTIPDKKLKQKVREIIPCNLSRAILSVLSVFRSVSGVFARAWPDLSHLNQVLAFLLPTTVSHQGQTAAAATTAALLYIRGFIAVVLGLSPAEKKGGPATEHILRHALFFVFARNIYYIISSEVSFYFYFLWLVLLSSY